VAAARTKLVDEAGLADGDVRWSDSTEFSGLLEHRLAQEDPGSMDVGLGQAFAALGAGNLGDAVARFSALAEQAGDSSVVFDGLGMALWSSGSVEAAARSFERSFACSIKAGSSLAALRTLIHLVSIHQALGEAAASRGWEQRGLSLLKEIGPCRERGYLALARVGCEVADADELAERAELALQAAWEFDDRNLELRAMGDKGLALVCQGNVRAGFALLDEVMVAVVAGEMDEPDTRGKTICAMLSACEVTGDVNRAEYWCHRIEDAPYLNHPILAVHCSILRGVVDTLRGRWESAEERFLAVLEAGENQRIECLARLAELRIQQGLYAEAAALLRGYEDQFQALPALAQLRLIEGKHADAAALLHAYARRLGGDRLRLAGALALLVQVELARGDRAAAMEAVARLDRLDDDCESNEVRALGRLARGQLALFEGDQENAIEQLETALALLIHYDRPLLSGRIRFDLAQALATAGKPAAAIIEAEASLATFRRLSVVPFIEVVEAFLEEVREAALTESAATRAVPGTGRAGRELTRREREVAQLVGEGLTNREIAGRLVLSVRTVETHVDRVLGKLNFHSRSQLIAWVHSTRDGPGAGPSAAQHPGG
jgi:DNA-binding CsgD family transcriptional regulator/tetratricopeptide (TPR) repeat protein